MSKACRGLGRERGLCSCSEIQSLAGIKNGDRQSPREKTPTCPSALHSPALLRPRRLGWPVGGGDRGEAMRPAGGRPRSRRGLPGVLLFTEQPQFGMGAGTGEGLTEAPAGASGERSMCHRVLSGSAF